MTEPSDPQAEAATDPGPEVKSEVIKDLDVTGDDADDIVGGKEPPPGGPIPVPYPN